MTTIFYDLETTGLNPFHDKIIEFTFIKNNLSLSSLVNPGIEISDKITKITSITNEMLKEYNMLNFYSDSILDFIKNNNESNEIYLIAHNNDGFDKFFLSEYFKSQNNTIYKNWKYIDTIFLAKKVMPNLYSYSLKNLCKYFSIQEGTHRSLSDTVALREVYYRLLQIYARKNKLSFDVLVNNPKLIYDYIY